MTYHQLATSSHWFPRFLRRGKRAVAGMSAPAPRVITAPLLNLVLVIRAVYYFVARVFFCEPLFKAYCTRYGKNVHTGVFLHWIQGRGELILGDDVLIDGKCSITFAARYTARPALVIGDRTGIGHACSFAVGKRITVGQDCRIASGVMIFDTPGHPLDPASRLMGNAAPDEDVKPVVIEDNVWIGRNATIMPGVTIGQGSVVATGSVVMTRVAPNVLVAGNPARQLRTLTTDAGAAARAVD